MSTKDQVNAAGTGTPPILRPMLLLNGFSVEPFFVFIPIFDDYFLKGAPT